MQGLDKITIDANFQQRVHLLAARLGKVRIIAPPAWQRFVAMCELDGWISEDTHGAALVAGPPAFILRQAAEESNEFGFVTPVAQIAARWQRAMRWRDDVTLGLWSAGWSPVDVDRLLVPTADATFEFVIGNARRTPGAAGVDGGPSALDSAD